MREIGSEFWNVVTNDQENGVFPLHTQWYLSGRSALQAIIKKLNECHTVSMPSWCCDSMIRPFIDAGIRVRFYPVYWQNGLVQHYDFDSDILFLMDYFGYTGIHPDLGDYTGVVIRDVTHSIFSFNYNDADYYFGSLRKWTGVWTGGYAWTRDQCHLPIEGHDNSKYIQLRMKAMMLKECYITGSMNSDGKIVSDKNYLQIYNEAENLLECAGYSPSIERDIQAAQYLNVEFIKCRRRTNAEYLMNSFPEWLIFPVLEESDCPMFVPILVPNKKRDALKNCLINQDIYCPVHWPESKYHYLTKEEKYLYQNELSLVCDQRYTVDDMKRMTNTINNFMEG